MTLVLHCEFAWLGGLNAASDVLITIEGDRIASVEYGVEAPLGATVVRGLTMPGMANAHSHAFHRALRGRTHGGHGSFWTWRDQMYELAARLDPDGYRKLATAVFGEMVLAGITCVGEFHYLHHGTGGARYEDPNAMGMAIVEAATEAGVRLTLLDTCYLAGGIGLPPGPVQERFSDGSAEAWAERATAMRTQAGPMVQVGAAVHSVRAVPPDDIAAVAAWAHQHDAVLHAHVSEQRLENQQCASAYGRTPVELFDENGALGPAFTAVHATHLTDNDRGLLGGLACTVCMCPTTERDLADGIGSSAAATAAGAHLSLGTDSHAMIDMFEEARAVELNQRLVTEERGHHSTVSLLEAATAGGYSSLGWGSGGFLAAGALADLVTVRTDSVRTAWCDADTVLDAVLYSASPADVEMVIVGGRTVVSGGRHTSLHVGAALAQEIRRWV